MSTPFSGASTTSTVSGARAYIQQIEERFLSREFREKHVTYALLYLKKNAPHAQDAIKVLEDYLSDKK